MNDVQNTEKLGFYHFLEYKLIGHVNLKRSKEIESKLCFIDFIKIIGRLLI